MADAWLLISAMAVAGIIFVAVGYFMVYFSSDYDRNQAWFPKAVVWFGLTFVCILVMLVPFDVANNRSDGGIQLENMWQFFFMGVAGMVAIVIPFTLFYYESQDISRGATSFRQLRNAILYTLACLVVVVVLTIVLWSVLGYADIPVESYSSALYPTSTSLDDVGCGASNPNCDGQEDDLEINVSLVVYIIAMMCLIGWVLFLLFAGIGLIAFPMDMINNFRKRPKPMSLETYAAKKAKLRDRVAKLIRQGEEVQKHLKGAETTKERSRARRERNELRADVYLAELQYSRLEVSYQKGGGSPWVAIANLIFGVLGLSMSFSWIIHIVLNNLLDKHAFLNNLFTELDDVFTLMGVLAFAFYAFYLLVCVIKGNTRFGLRFFFISIHPMRVGDTTMNSMLVNTILLMLTSVVTVMFCIDSFQIYARDTDASVLFTQYVYNLRGLKYFFEYYLYGLLGVSALALVYLVICPRNLRKKKEKQMEEKDIELAQLNSTKMPASSKTKGKKPKKKVDKGKKPLSFADRARMADRL